MKDAIDAAKEALVIYSEGKSEVPLGSTWIFQNMAARAYSCRPT